MQTTTSSRTRGQDHYTPDSSKRHFKTQICQERCADGRTQTFQEGHRCGWCLYVLCLVCHGWPRNHEKDCAFRATPEEHPPGRPNALFAALLGVQEVSVEGVVALHVVFQADLKIAIFAFSAGRAIPKSPKSPLAPHEG